MAAKTLRDTTAGVGKKAAASAGRATKAATGAGSTIQKKTQQAIPASPCSNRCRISPQPWLHAQPPGSRARYRRPRTG